ncbi:uncharacterized protein LOC119660102 [Hermetia illucens]|uniref:uncharacterized protein LOC119660102 n=1 Tax=Hermetia illucens TaxID=343691 RepID=UPI0018CC5DB5|nr:uncharacterized protein LOC119660102 [Hermetia illucens]
MDITERAVYRGQLTKLTHSASEYLNSSDSKSDKTEDIDLIEDELVSFIERINSVLGTLRKCNDEIRPSIKLENAQKEFETIYEYEDKAANILSHLNQRLKRLRKCCDNLDTSLSSSLSIERKKEHTFSSAKLPKLSLKVFSGHFHEWLPFRERFRVAVHDRTDLTGADKFNYFSNHLVGKAADTIAGFTPTNANYDSAVSLLLEQYGNVDKLVDHTMQQLMNLSRINSRHDVTKLRKLYTDIRAHTRSLTALNVLSSQYSIMLRSLILHCLPHDLVIDFHRLHPSKQDKAARSIEDENASLSVGTSEHSSCGGDQLNDILSFIKEEISSLEMAELTNGRRTRTSKVANTCKTAAGLLTTTNIAELCCFCKSNSHLTENCKTTLSLAEKKTILKSMGYCFKCTKKGHNAKRCFNKRVKCSLCGSNHATSMHDPTYRPKAKNTTTVRITTVYASALLQTEEVLLQTATIIASSNSSSVPVRIILGGGSQRTFVKENIVTKLQLDTHDTVKLRILPFGDSNNSEPKLFKRVQIKLRSLHSDEAIEILAIVVPEICSTAFQYVRSTELNILGLKLADTSYLNETEFKIGMLIGADIYWSIVKDDFKRITDNLVAIDTIFGWTLQGPISTQGTSVTSTNLNVGVIEDNSLESLVDRIERLWIVDDITSNHHKLQVDDIIEKHIRKNGTRYEASLLWRNDECTIDNNRGGALKGLRRSLVKLSEDPEKLRQYDEIIREMISSGVAEICDEAKKTNERTYFMPHRPVYREERETTKTRIVFNASARSGGNPSLNDLLWSGPNLLSDILKMILNFRLGKHGITADIERAFLQIELAQKDRKESFYVDDLIVSVDDFEDAVKLFNETREILSRASMNIRKWKSNNEKLRQIFDTNESNNISKHKVLGLIWFMEIDTLAVDLERLCQQISFDVVTKRTILQTLASVYDPLGMLSPFVIKMKLIFQEAWKQSLAWDEILPASMLHEWKKSVSEIHLLRALTISRYVFDSPHQVEKQLHIFADASPKAYGSVAYIRSRNLDETIRISFLYAKSRLAPIRDKRITLPKIELCADLEAARMRCYLVEKLRVKFDSIYLWTDSKITLYWIHSSKFQKDVFVYNRVQEIQQLTANDNWNHCPGSINPADLLTRGVSAQTLLSCETWLNGPSWLYNDISEWPISDQDFETIPQSTTQSDCAVPDNPIQIERFSKYRRLLRVTAYVLRYVDLLRKRNDIGVSTVEDDDTI